MIALPGQVPEDTVAFKIVEGAYPELGKKELLAVPFPMSKDPEVLKSYHDAGADKVKAVLDQGKDVVFLTLGDPTVYSTYLYIHHRLVAQGYETEIVCGITSFCAVSARLNTGLVEKAEPLHVIPASYQIEDALKLSGTKVLMKAGKKMKDVKAELLSQGAEAMMIENCGMPDEKIYRTVEEIPEDAGYYSLIPAWSSFNLGAISSVFGQCFKADFSSLRAFDFVAIVCAFLFVDIFDTLGTLIGCATKADMLDKEGKLPRIKEALLADAIATTAGAVLGTSTTTTFVESSAGVAEGGRTGLSSVVTGLLFLLAVFLSPIFITIPSFATAPALLFVGFLMISAVTAIDFNDFTEAVPAYLALIAMPLTYSISEGIAAGVISYVVINLISGKAKKITPLMYVLAVLFVCKYIFL